MFKLAYSYGLRFNELRHLQTVDFARNPHARKFGRYGVVHVRYGKAKKGSPPKRRSVLTVFDWTPEVITDWLAHGQPYMGDGIDLFPSERGALVSEDTLLRRFRRYCEDLGLSAGLDLGFGETQRPDNPFTAPSALRSKKSPKPSSFSLGLMRSISAQRPRAVNKTSTNG